MQPVCGVTLINARYIKI